MHERLIKIATLCLVFAFFISMTRFSVSRSVKNTSERQAYSCIVVRGDKIEVIQI